VRSGNSVANFVENYVGLGIQAGFRMKARTEIQCILDPDFGEFLTLSDLIQKRIRGKL